MIYKMLYRKRVAELNAKAGFQVHVFVSSYF